MQSVLKTRLTYQGALRPAQQRIVEELEANAAYLTKRSQVVAAGDDITQLYILRSGWAVSRFGAEPRRSAITRLYLPGDIIGLTELVSGVHPYDVTMISDGSVAAVPKRRMLRLSYTNPGLAGRLAYFDQLDSIATQERLFTMGRGSAMERLKHFFLTVHARQSATMAIPADKMPFYMQMNELGDTNGLSAVTISNVMGRLRKSGAVTLSKAAIELHHRDQWAKELNFVNRYAPRAQWAA